MVVVCVLGFVNGFGSGVRRLTIRPRHSSQGVDREKGVPGLTLVTVRLELVGVGMVVWVVGVGSSSEGEVRVD